MSNNNLILVEANNMYTNQLIEFISIPIYKIFQTLYNISKSNCDNNGDSNYMLYFQYTLEKVRLWNSNQIDDETKKIEKMSECDYLLDILTAIFVNSTKILINAKGKSKKKIDVNIPKLSVFIHNCLIKISRILWTNPKLMADYDLLPWEMQQNLQLVHDLIDKSIRQTINTMLPMKEIITDYLDTTTNRNLQTEILDYMNNTDYDTDELLAETDNDTDTDNESVNIDEFEELKIDKGENASEVQLKPEMISKQSDTIEPNMLVFNQEINVDCPSDEEPQNLPENASVKRGAFSENDDLKIDIENNEIVDVFTESDTDQETPLDIKITDTSIEVDEDDIKMSKLISKQDNEDFSFF